MPRPFPKEFRDDVVRVARAREPGQTIKQIASDSGVSESCLTNWLTAADREDGVKPGPTASESAELRGAAPPQPAAGAGERGAATGCRVLVAGEPAGKMIYPLVRDLAAAGAPVRVPVAVTCRVLNLCRQAYYRWLEAPVTDADWIAAHRANALFDAHRDDAEFGYRFLADEARDAGQAMADRTAWRICSANRWWSVFGKPKAYGKARRPGAPAHEDHVRRGFTAPAPNQLWLTDMPPQAGGAPSEHWTGEGKLYLCAVKDVWSNRIVGYSVDSRMKSRLAVAAIDNAVARRRADGETTDGCIAHSDRGSQFRSRKVQRTLTRHGMVGSMGQVGSAADNAAMESFFSLLQRNVLDRRRWTSREELRIAIVTWIERTYHRRRRQAGLGKLTPIEYETIMTATAAQAA